MSLCSGCYPQWIAWLDYERKPVTGWKQYPPNPVRDAEARKSRIEDRIALIKRQMAGIESDCKLKHGVDGGS